MSATRTTEDDRYCGTWLHLYRTSGTLSRFPMYDNIGSARGLLDASGTATDWYELDTFGRQVSSSGTTPNPYRFGAAWGYITDPSGFLQLGERYYWPEVGRFVSQDPSGEGMDWYVYAGSNPVALLDPEGSAARSQPKQPADPCKQCTEDFRKGIKACADVATGQTAGTIAGAAVGRHARGGRLGFLAAFLFYLKFCFSLDDYANCLQDKIDKYKACWDKHKCKGTPPGLAPYKKRGGPGKR